MAEFSALEAATRRVTDDRIQIAAQEAEIAGGVLRGEPTSLAREKLKSCLQNLRFHIFARDLIQARISVDQHLPPIART
ncbi:hypothetical protein [Rhizobium leguminosarum]|uniref:hypothetical protein n=1 Tax=Rhizobium leguminosarum TaxID=384 RepID=UPI001319FF8A|nr:hypothetical protein [Rhizobium leguminosarum]